MRLLDKGDSKMAGRDSLEEGSPGGKSGATGIPPPHSPPGEDRDDRESIDALLILSQITSTVSGLSELDTILRVGVQKTLEFIKGSFGGVMFLNERTGSLRYYIYQGLSEKFAQEVCVELGQGINGRVASTGKAILLDDISTEPDALYGDLIRREGLRAFISVPLRFRERVLGVLNCASPRTHHFVEKDMHLLNSIGDQLGLAVGHFRLHERLQEKRERYRDVARQVITAQEKEKKRISQELHDETSQMLAALTLNLKTLSEMARMMGLEDQKFLAMLAKVHAAAVQINNEVNRIISDLRPTLLDSLGFIPAIRHYAESCLLPLNIDITFEIMEGPLPLTVEDEVNLFRWVQGVVGNIVQHSRAENVTISLQKKNEQLEFRIQDDGVGFDVSRIGRTNSRKRRHGMGLIIAKERMKLIGGNCSVHSQPGCGTTVLGVIPLS